jgi:hypothetical protein
MGEEEKGAQKKRVFRQKGFYFWKLGNTVRISVGMDMGR